MNLPLNNRIAILLVICSQTEGRLKIAHKVLDSLISLTGELTDFDLYVLDNGSKYRIDLVDSKFPITEIQIKKNIGYWSAVAYFLKILRQKREYPNYVYIVESDNVHYNLSKLDNARMLMQDVPSIASVRAQEFSVRYRWRYSKELRFMIFRKNRSLVSLRNLATGEKSRFTKPSNFRGVYVANWHTKLPSLHRTDILMSVFDQLEQLSEFTEKDFFSLMSLYTPLIGVIDGGCYFTTSNYSNRRKVLSGSWLGEYGQSDMDYQTTRNSKIKLPRNSEISQIVHHEVQS